MAYLSTKRRIPERKAHGVPNLELPRLALFLMIRFLISADLWNKAGNNVFDSQSADQLPTEGSVTHASRGNTTLSCLAHTGRCRQRTYFRGGVLVMNKTVRS